MGNESHDLKELNIPPFCQCLNSKPQLNEWEGLLGRESHDLKVRQQGGGGSRAKI